MTTSAILSDLDNTRSYREELYKFFHQHPELSLQGFGTSKRIGDTGVIAGISNGDGPVVVLRDDIDGLPMAERSGKEYAAAGVPQVDNNTGGAYLWSRCASLMIVGCGAGV